MAEIRHFSFLWKILISIGRLCSLWINWAHIHYAFCHNIKRVQISSKFCQYRDRWYVPGPLCSSIHLIGPPFLRAFNSVSCKSQSNEQMSLTKSLWTRYFRDKKVCCIALKATTRRRGQRRRRRHTLSVCSLLLESCTDNVLSTEVQHNIH